MGAGLPGEAALKLRLRARRMKKEVWEGWGGSGAEPGPEAGRC